MPTEELASPARAGETVRSRWPLPGLFVGSVAALAAAFALPTVGRFALGILLVDIGLAWGFVSLARVLVREPRAAPWDAAVAAFSPFVGLGYLLRRWAIESNVQLPLPFWYSHLLEFLILASLLGFWALLLRRPEPAPGRVLGFMGGFGLLLAAGLIVVIGVLPPAPTPGATGILLLTFGFVAAALLAQAFAARRLPGAWSRLASAPALALAGAQLLDGIVTYFAVKDPLGWAPGEFHEAIALSAFILDKTGPGYPLLKWALALVIAHFIDRERSGGRSPDPFRRFGFYLVLVYVGLQPGLFSASRLL